VVAGIFVVPVGFPGGGVQQTGAATVAALSRRPWPLGDVPENDQVWRR